MCTQCLPTVDIVHKHKEYDVQTLCLWEQLQIQSSSEDLVPGYYHTFIIFCILKV